MTRAMIITIVILLSINLIICCCDNSDVNPANKNRTSTVNNETNTEYIHGVITMDAVWLNIDPRCRSILDLPSTPATERVGFPYSACIIDRTLLIFTERGTCGPSIDGILFLDKENINENIMTLFNSNNSIDIASFDSSIEDNEFVANILINDKNILCYDIAINNDKLSILSKQLHIDNNTVNHAISVWRYIKKTADVTVIPIESLSIRMVDLCKQGKVSIVVLLSGYHLLIPVINDNNDNYDNK